MTINEVQPFIIWDDKLSFDEFCRLEHQLLRGEITLSDLWFLLGGGDENEHSHSTNPIKRAKNWSGRYLIRLGREGNAAHLWDGRDTLCRMYSTGGIRNKKSYTVCDSPSERRICPMCERMSK